MTAPTSMTDDSFDWAVVVDGNVVDRFPTFYDAWDALAEGGYPADAEVVEEPPADFSAATR